MDLGRAGAGGMNSRRAEAGGMDLGRAEPDYAGNGRICRKWPENPEIAGMAALMCYKLNETSFLWQIK